ncbi:MAG: MOSC domain-containing protein [Chloroflexi bacterium]|nr:MOSC domain-containing protein [Chloroflexota bacterium]
MKEAKVFALCISEAKGTQKHEVASVELIPDHGIKGDAHAGNWHRQVSLLSEETVEDFRLRGVEVDNGAFGENILIEGLNPVLLPVGSKLQIADALLEVTQIGKECHSHCRIYETVGDCIMPREGVFTKVLTGGCVKKGDRVHVL